MGDDTTAVVRETFPGSLVEGGRTEAALLKLMQKLNVRMKGPVQPLADGSGGFAVLVPKETSRDFERAFTLEPFAGVVRLAWGEEAVALRETGENAMPLAEFDAIDFFGEPEAEAEIAPEPSEPEPIPSGPMAQDEDYPEGGIPPASEPSPEPAPPSLRIPGGWTTVAVLVGAGVLVLLMVGRKRRKPEEDTSRKP